jgi:hypothetical protein
MGLLTHLFISIINLIFIAMDILLLMILAKIVYQRWRLSWLKQVVDTVEPLISSVLGHFQRLISRITGKTYSKRISLNLLVFCLWITRLIVAGLL